ncbi:hypothetical protein BGZ82_003652 [Podila clonocystis]|nr:hypothetical protein BGZ82_003652 [Podila clonocystis]
MYTLLQNRTLWSTSESAFKAIDKALLDMFYSRDRIELMFDSVSPQEKDQTTMKRWDNRNKQRLKASRLMDELEESVDTKGRWAGKGKTCAFRSSLQKAWYLSVDGRRALSAYLAAQGWISQVATFEADVELARMCQPVDIVVTKDSDFAAYLSIKTIASPLRHGFFIYDVDKMCSVVGLPSRAHLQALAVVSRNDYGHNIYGLGFETNAKILKKLPASITDVETLVSLYLLNSQVQLKNTEMKDFQSALKVFGRMEQTLSSLLVAEPACDDPKTLKDRFYKLQDKHKQNKKACTEEKEKQKKSARQKPGRNYNMYCTVEPVDVLGRTDSFDQVQGWPRLRYSYSTVPEHITHVTPEQAKPFQQLKRKKASPTTTASANEDFNTTTGNTSNTTTTTTTTTTTSNTSSTTTTTAASNSIEDEDESDDDELEAVVRTGSAQSPSPCLEKKRELSRKHPTLALKIGSLQRNIHLVNSTNPEMAESATASSSSTAMSTSTTDTHPHLATVIEELVQIWNYYKRHAQQAFALFLAEQDEESLEFITLKAAFDLPKSRDSSKEGNRAIRSNLAALLARLLLRLATRTETHSRTDKWTAVLSIIYHNYTRINNNISLDNPKNYALCHLFGPLSTEMSKETVCAWNSQVEGMTAKLNKNPDAKLLESELPNNLLERFLLLRGLLHEHEQPALCPISPVSYGYMQLSELVFMQTIYSSCKDDVKRGLGISFNPVANYLYINLGQQAPGLFLSRLLVPVNSRKHGYRSHLQVAPLGQEPDASPKRYALTGTFRTNGLVLQVLAYDLRITKGQDIQAAPARMDPKVGPGRWLKEIRHEFATQDDVEHTFGPYFESADIGKDVWLVGVDFGQVCTAAVSVHIPPLVLDQAQVMDDNSSFMEVDEGIVSFKEDEDFIMYESELPPVPGSDPTRDIDSPSTVPRGHFRNLVIKSKALYQPQFRHRRYLESSKSDEVQASERSIKPHKGIYDDKVLDFVESRIDASLTLNHHYNNTFRHRWHLWEFEKAKEAEY